MPTLAIDTSARTLSVATTSNGNTYTRIRVCETDSHFELLDYEVREVLKDANINLLDVNHIILGAGPGSFTGLRIGFSWASGFAFANGCPITQISTFEGAAYSLYESGVRSEEISIIADARKKEIYLAKYSLKKEGVLELKSAFIAPKERASGDLFEINSTQLFPNATSICAISRGLLAHPSAQKPPPYSPELLAKLEPLYVRSIQAKKISERSLTNG